MGFEVPLGPQAWHFFADHRVGGSVVVPAAAYLEMAVAALRPATGQTVALTDVLFERPLVLQEGACRGGDPQRLRIQLQPDGGFVVASHGAEGSVVHVRGCAALASSGSDVEGGGLKPGSQAQQINGSSAPLLAAQVYSDFFQAGLTYGPEFRTLRDGWLGANQAEATVVTCSDQWKAFLV